MRDSTLYILCKGISPFFELGASLADCKVTAVRLLFSWLLRIPLSLLMHVERVLNLVKAVYLAVTSLLGRDARTVKRLICKTKVSHL